MKQGQINSATMRKVKNRGFTPIKYHTKNSVRFGWIFKTGRTLLHLWLAGDEYPKSVPIATEGRFIKELI